MGKVIHIDSICRSPQGELGHRNKGDVKQYCKLDQSNIDPICRSPQGELGHRNKEDVKQG